MPRIAKANSPSASKMDCAEAWPVDRAGIYPGADYSKCASLQNKSISHGTAQVEQFVASYGGKLGDISLYGQESNATPPPRGKERNDARNPGRSCPERADTFMRDLHSDLSADYLLDAVATIRK